jgi:hypothetical protein
MFSTLQMERKQSSETSALTKSTQRYIPACDILPVFDLFINCELITCDCTWGSVLAGSIWETACGVFLRKRTEKLRRGARETKRKEELRQVKARKWRRYGTKNEFFLFNSSERFLSNWKWRVPREIVRVSEWSFPSFCLQIYTTLCIRKKLLDRKSFCLVQCIPPRKFYSI